MPHFASELRFVESTDEGYSIYSDRDGLDVFVQDGTGRIVVELDSLDVLRLWNKRPYPRRRSDFEDYLRSLVIDPTEVDDRVLWCEDCDEPTTEEDDLRQVGDGSLVCDSCISGSYAWCEGCDSYEREYSSVYDYDNIRCESCIETYYRYCDYCDMYVDRDDYEHDHDEDCDCEAPEQTFSVRNDGQGRLANDSRVKVALPAGEISDEGVNEIVRLVRNHVPDVTGLTDDEAADLRNKWWRLSCLILDELDQTWQTKQGNYTKRLSRLAYKEFGLKIPASMLSEVGNIGRAHSAGVDFDIEVTRNLNLPAEDFYHDGSCWWTEYAESRCALKSSGGFGLRTFGATAWGDTVQGRAWVMPLRKTEDGELVATFDTETPDAYVVFNGYGDLSGYTPARIMAHMAGWTYRKVSFSSGPMYVNGDSAYLVAPEEIAADYTDGNLHVPSSAHSDLHSREARTLTLV